MTTATQATNRIAAKSAPTESMVINATRNYMREIGEIGERGIIDKVIKTLDMDNDGGNRIWISDTIYRLKN